MSSRQEEKERRRREREEQERKAAAGAQRSRRLQIVGGVLLAVAIVAVAVVLLTSGGGGGGNSGPSTSASSEVTLPPQKIQNLNEAAKAGGCTLRDFPDEGNTHTEKSVKYKTNPPTSGDHNPVPAADGVYTADNTPSPEHYVHTLEHGRIIFQYKPGADAKTVGTLEALFNEPFNGTPGYHAVVMQNNTGMKAPVAATAWTHMLTCDQMTPQAIDAFRAFRDRYTDKAPEFVP
jgi:hypothetical protein